MRADLATLETTDSAQARALRRVLGWAEYAEFKEGSPYPEGRVRSLLDLAVRRFTDEANACTGAGDTEGADAHRRSAAALAQYF
ncbi:hypothetical protein [Cellulomonas chitinilytica]|nr:hypothetical protein [Cellulomonas chitinilytica]